MITSDAPYPSMAGEKVAVAEPGTGPGRTVTLSSGVGSCILTFAAAGSSYEITNAGANFRAESIRTAGASWGNHTAKMLYGNGGRELVLTADSGAGVITLSEETIGRADDP